MKTYTSGPVIADSGAHPGPEDGPPAPERIPESFKDISIERVPISKAFASEKPLGEDVDPLELQLWHEVEQPKASARSRDPRHADGTFEALGKPVLRGK